MERAKYNDIKAIIVEDNHLLAMHLESMLEILGFSHIAIANSVLDANSCLDDDRFGLAIVDLRLGDENGLAVADRCFGEAIPVIISTGYGSEMRAAFKNDEIFLQKPYNLSDLTNAINIIFQI